MENNSDSNHDTKPPRRYFEIKERYPEIIDSYEQLASNVIKSSPLNKKEIALAKIGISIGLGHLSNLKSQVKKAIEAGIDHESIRSVALLSITTIGFSKMMAALSTIDEIFNN
jgi:alkylhydroperoxidase/carboxymuconolactone decarboxylase family protein YurZ